MAGPEQPQLAESSDNLVKIDHKEGIDKDLSEQSKLLREKIAEFQKGGKEVTDEEWGKIHDSIQKSHHELLEKLGIDSAKKLKEFSQSEKSETEIYAQETIEETLTKLRELRRSKEFDSFMESLPLELRQAVFQKMSTSDSYLLLFSKNVKPYVLQCPNARELFITAATQAEDDQLFTEYKEKYMDLPYRLDILKAAAQVLYGDDIKKLFKNYNFDSITEQEKNEVLASLPETRQENPKGIAQKIIREPDHANTSKFLQDKAIRNLTEVREEWIIQEAAAMKLVLNDEAVLQMRTMIARNLFFHKTPLNRDNVVLEMTRILETREKYKNIRIFDRNILLGAHGQELPDGFHEGGKERFGKKGLLEGLKHQQTGNQKFESFRPKDQSIQEARNAKKSFMEKLATMPPPLTIVLDGHGSEDAFHFYSGQVQGSVVVDAENDLKITYKEMADAFVERSKSFPKLKTNDPNQKDILILSCCFSSTLLRSIYDEMGDAPKPITLGESEYGQLGFNDFDSPMGGRFLAKTLGLDSSEPSTFGSVFANDLKDFSVPESQFNRSPNACLYIPDNTNEPMQISENERERIPNV